MLWLIIIILAYFLLAISALGDEYLLGGPPNPKSYSFYVGTLGLLVIVLIPFVGFSIPDTPQIVLSLLAGTIFIFALFGFFTGLEYYEVSRIVPAVGALLPLFTFGLVFLFSGGKEILILREFFAFLLLILGSVFISLVTGKKISFKSLQISALTAFLFALSFVLAKYVYLAQPFWSGFISMRVGGFLAALCFLFSKQVRDEIFRRKSTFQRKTGTIFLGNQVVGASAFLLQNWAIALVPLSLLPFINALEGIKYVFLLSFTTLLSLKFPQILKEEISRKTIIQKIIAISLIIGGLVLLAIK